MHYEERALSLQLKKCRMQPGLAFNQVQVRNSVRTMHLFGPQAGIMMPVRIPSEGRVELFKAAACTF